MGVKPLLTDEQRRGLETRLLAALDKAVEVGDLEAQRLGDAIREYLQVPDAFATYPSALGMVVALESKLGMRKKAASAAVAAAAPVPAVPAAPVSAVPAVGVVANVKARWAAASPVAKGIVAALVLGAGVVAWRAWKPTKKKRGK